MIQELLKFLEKTCSAGFQVWWRVVKSWIKYLWTVECNRRSKCNSAEDSTCQNFLISAEGVVDLRFTRFDPLDKMSAVWSTQVFCVYTYRTVMFNSLGKNALTHLQIKRRYTSNCCFKVPLSADTVQNIRPHSTESCKINWFTSWTLYQIPQEPHIYKRLR